MHTLMIWQNRGLLKKTGVVLAMATFGLCNFATFITRSGIFSSLHAFSESRIGWLFLALMVAFALGGGTLVVMRRGCLTPERHMSTIWSRESMIAVSTIALLALTVVVCGGTLSAALSQAVIGRKILVGIAFYNNVLIPTGLLLLATMAMAPLLKWGVPPTWSQKRLLVLSVCCGGFAAAAAYALGVRYRILVGVIGLATLSVAALAGALYLDARRRQSRNPWTGLLGSVQENRRQYGGFVIHMGFVCLALGVTGSSLGTRRHEAVMAQGDTIEWSGRRVRFVQVVQRELPDKLVAEAQLEVCRDDHGPDSLRPAKHFHVAQNEWTTEVAIQSDWRGDFYTILHSGEGTGRVRLTFVDNPMMRWIWLGGGIMGVGVVIALWPTARSFPRTSSTSSAGAPLRGRHRRRKTRRLRSPFRARAGNLAGDVFRETNVKACPGINQG
jgi:cytochrome c-type biogenesis protein CcmF